VNLGEPLSPAPEQFLEGEGRMRKRITSIFWMAMSLSTSLFAQSLSIDDVSLNEGNGGQTIFTFTVSLSPVSGSPVTVDWHTEDGSAVSGFDYVSGSGTLNFGPGVGSQPIQILVNGDTVLEPDENFVVQLTNASGAALGDHAGFGTLLNDDVEVTIGPDISHPEGDSGLTNYDFMVSLSAPYPLTVSVNWSTSDGTAQSGSDYVAASGTVTFAPGETSHPVTVQAIGDTVLEPDEDFMVQISNAVNGTITDRIAIGTILNDEVAYTLSMSADISQLEGNLGFTNYDFSVTLSPPSAQTVTVDWTTSDGTATSGSDYVAGSGILMFTSGQISQPITVQAIGDTVLESSESFNVTLSGAFNATISDASAVGWLLNDDVGIYIQPDTFHDEGNLGFTNYDFTVNLTGAYTLPIGVNWTTADGSALAADNDYVPASGSLTFNPGETSKPITVQAVGDAKVEINETFFVNLSGGVNASIIDSSVVGTIVNDDTTSTVSITFYSSTEGNSGLTTFSFPVNLSAPSSDVVSVSFATTDGTALAGSDYTAASGVLTFDPGEVEKLISVDVRGDDVHEGDEFFTVELSDPMNATISVPTATGTILNDDALALSIDDVSQMEGNSATSGFSFTLSLSNPSELAASVAYRLTPISASEGVDYLPGTGTVSFPPGTTSLPLLVDVVGDSEHEIDETFTVDLYSPSVLSILDAQGLGTILDDDTACTPGPEAVRNLMVTVTGGGSELQVSWTDTPDSVAYDLYESGVPLEPFTGPVGSSTSGVMGVRLPLPSDDRFYLLTSTSPACGEGPRRLCAHDICEEGGRLDSGCDPCAAAVCEAESSCCVTQWSASCVAEAVALCRVTCN